MKTITTSKGEFVADEIDINELAMCKFFNNPKMFIHGIHLQPMFLLSEATEEDALKIIDYEWFDMTDELFCRDYLSDIYDNYDLTSALESIHSLLISKGIDINNGNWYLFKKI